MSLRMLADIQSVDSHRPAVCCTVDAANLSSSQQACSTGTPLFSFHGTEVEAQRHRARPSQRQTWDFTRAIVLVNHAVLPLSSRTMETQEAKRAGRLCPPLLSHLTEDH